MFGFPTLNQSPIRIICLLTKRNSVNMDEVDLHRLWTQLITYRPNAKRWSKKKIKLELEKLKESLNKGSGCVQVSQPQHAAKDLRAHRKQQKTTTLDVAPCTQVIDLNLDTKIATDDTSAAFESPKASHPLSSSTPTRAFTSKDIKLQLPTDSEGNIKQRRISTNSTVSRCSHTLEEQPLEALNVPIDEPQEVCPALPRRRGRPPKRKNLSTVSTPATPANTRVKRFRFVVEPVSNDEIRLLPHVEDQLEANAEPLPHYSRIVQKEQKIDIPLEQLEKQTCVDLPSLNETGNSSHMPELNWGSNKAQKLDLKSDNDIKSLFEEVAIKGTSELLDDIFQPTLAVDKDSNQITNEASEIDDTYNMNLELFDEPSYMSAGNNSSNEQSLKRQLANDHSADSKIIKNLPVSRRTTSTESLQVDNTIAAVDNNDEVAEIAPQINEQQEAYVTPDNLLTENIATNDSPEGHRASTIIDDDSSEAASQDDEKASPSSFITPENLLTENIATNDRSEGYGASTISNDDRGSETASQDDEKTSSSSCITPDHLRTKKIATNDSPDGYRASTITDDDSSETASQVDEKTSSSSCITPDHLRTKNIATNDSPDGYRASTITDDDSSETASQVDENTYPSSAEHSVEMLTDSETSPSNSSSSLSFTSSSSQSLISVKSESTTNAEHENRGNIRKGSTCTALPNIEKGTSALECNKEKAANTELDNLQTENTLTCSTPENFAAKSMAAYRTSERSTEYENDTTIDQLTENINNFDINQSQSQNERQMLPLVPSLNLSISSSTLSTGTDTDSEIYDETVIQVTQFDMAATTEVHKTTEQGDGREVIKEKNTFAAFSNIDAATAATEVDNREDANLEVNRPHHNQLNVGLAKPTCVQFISDDDNGSSSTTTDESDKSLSHSEHSLKIDESFPSCSLSSYGFNETTVKNETTPKHKIATADNTQIEMESIKMDHNKTEQVVRKANPNVSTGVQNFNDGKKITRSFTADCPREKEKVDLVPASMADEDDIKPEFDDNDDIMSITTSWSGSDIELPTSVNDTIEDEKEKKPRTFETHVALEPHGSRNTTSEVSQPSVVELLPTAPKQTTNSSLVGKKLTTSNKSRTIIFKRVEEPADESKKFTSANQLAEAKHSHQPQAASAIQNVQNAHLHQTHRQVLPRERAGAPMLPTSSVALTLGNNGNVIASGANDPLPQPLQQQIGSFFDIFGVKCVHHLDGCCFDQLSNQHSHKFHAVGTVQNKLFRLRPEELLNAYRFMCRSKLIFQRFCVVYANVCATRKQTQELLQLISDCSRYPAVCAEFLPIFYNMLQECGLSATQACHEIATRLLQPIAWIQKWPKLLNALVAIILQSGWECSLKFVEQIAAIGNYKFEPQALGVILSDVLKKGNYSLINRVSNMITTMRLEFYVENKALVQQLVEKQLKEFKPI